MVLDELVFQSQEKRNVVSNIHQQWYELDGFVMREGQRIM